MMRLFGYLNGKNGKGLRRKGGEATIAKAAFERPLWQVDG